MERVICPYCSRRAKFIHSARYYKSRINYGMMYLCEPCDATVGCHKDSNKPKGSLANVELRELRKRCHSLFDQLWQGNRKNMHRERAYKRLARLMNMKKKDAHIGKFREEDCRRMIRIFTRMAPILGIAQ